jgi:hypothetical protein
VYQITKSFFKLKIQAANAAPFSRTVFPVLRLPSVGATKQKAPTGFAGRSFSVYFFNPPNRLGFCRKWTNWFARHLQKSKSYSK